MSQLTAQCEAVYIKLSSRYHCVRCALNWDEGQPIPGRCQAFHNAKRQKLAKTEPGATEIPILLNHKKTAKSIVGWIRIKNRVMTIEFNKGFEPNHAKMQDLFGCAAGNILQEIEVDGEKRIKLFRVQSWGYK